MESKEEFIEKIQIALSRKMEKIRIDNNICLNDKMTQTDILLDTIKFLKDYDRNVKILNRYKDDFER